MHGAMVCTIRAGPEAGTRSIRARRTTDRTRTAFATGTPAPGAGGRLPVMSTVAAPALVRTALPFPDRREGKVRDCYRLPSHGDEAPRLLIVATDRISAFDVVLPTPIPGKGRLLTQCAVRWFEWLRPSGLVADHLLSTDPGDIEGLTDIDRSRLAGRIMIGRAAAVIPIECVVRGYLAGSGWSAYERTQSICGVALPRGLRTADRLPEPIFTPATKAAEGHDENIGFDTAASIAGRDVMERLRSISLAIYARAHAHAEARGVILADTKFEFGFALGPDGRPTDELLLIDEILTPDSSRYWPLESWAPGREQPSFDKQFVRNYLLALEAEGRWDRRPPGPGLPPEVVARTIERYEEAWRRLFG